MSGNFVFSFEMLLPFCSIIDVYYVYSDIRAAHNGGKRGKALQNPAVIRGQTNVSNTHVHPHVF